MLVDAGPLIALLDRSDSQHEICTHSAASIDAELITTWPVFTEAMHVLISRLGKRKFGIARDSLWTLVQTGQLVLVDLTASETQRAAALMRKYSDLPMDLADATLVAVAESRAMHTIFSLDSDFRVYRILGRKSFRVIPAIKR
jgi:predicted nucleic acid-binding protein